MEVEATISIKRVLLELPDDIKRKADAVLDLQVEKCKQERELDLTQAEITFNVFADPELKNDTTRKAVLVKKLSTISEYTGKQKELDKTKLLLERARIAYHRSRDTFDAYRSIAGMAAKA